MTMSMSRAAIAAGVVAFGVAADALGRSASNFAIATPDYSSVPGSWASGLSVTGEFFNSPFGGDLGKNVLAATFNLFPEAEFDTYGDINAGGPVSATNAGNAQMNFLTGAGFTSGITDVSQTRGAVSQSGGGVPSAARDFSFGTFEALFLGRFTYTGELSGDIGFGPVRLDGVVIDEGPFSNGLGYLLDLGETLTLSTGDSISLVTVDIDNSSVASLDGFTTTDVYAVLNVPAPGAAALLGVAGVASVRRRR